jgi:anthranilate synthase
MSNFKVFEFRRELKYQAAHELFAQVAGNYSHKFLYESKDVADIYGRMSIAGVDPVLEVFGKGDKFEIKVLNQRGDSYLNFLTDQDFSFCDELTISEKGVFGTVSKSDVKDESQRLKRRNISLVLDLLINKFKSEEKVFHGLYGAFAYNFVNLFEDLDIKKESNCNDFHFFLYDTFFYFDHLKERSEFLTYRLENKEPDLPQFDAVVDNFEVGGFSYCLGDDKFKKLVNIAREKAKKGDIFEVVFSDVLKANFKGDPYDLYLKYREANPSPYLFFFDFGDRQLVGASPEMMVRVEKNKIHLRPISGTAPRGKDPVQDHENMLALLADPKERAELDMLIDLGRNDLSRICQPKIKVKDYRFVEKYSKVMHTVAHLTGELQSGVSLIQAYAACANAGTLTGAPKIAAMQLIEDHEPSARNFYGGSIGYMSFSGEMDTGIIIRTADIYEDELSYQTGATLLYSSDPEKELLEIQNKAAAFVSVFRADDSLENAFKLPQFRSLRGLVVDNFDSFTYNLVDAFSQFGVDLSVVRNDISLNDLSDDYDFVVLSPGPGTPREAGNLMKIIDLYVQKNVPILGVCLGHQALVEYFGGTLRYVKPVHGISDEVEILDSKSLLFADLPVKFKVGRYHSLAADRMLNVLKETATLASEDIVMAFRHVELPVFGVQFHPESILSSANETGIKILFNFLKICL